MSDGSYALDLLENKNDWKKPFLTDIWSPMLCGMLGFGAACFINFGTRRPIFSGMEFSRKKVLHKQLELIAVCFLGLQRHAIFTTLGVVTGSVLERWRNEHLAERDAVLRHYVQLHPEDFPNPGNCLYFISNCKFLIAFLFQNARSLLRSSYHGSQSAKSKQSFVNF